MSVKSCRPGFVNFVGKYGRAWVILLAIADNKYTSSWRMTLCKLKFIVDRRHPHICKLLLWLLFSVYFIVLNLGFRIHPKFDRHKLKLINDGVANYQTMSVWYFIMFYSSSSNLLGRLGSKNSIVKNKWVLKKILGISQLLIYGQLHFMFN